ncbi:MAG: tRNA preQ1(34) S-adenosylmethionine ribosyltransferase-isomerase QueA [Proteobacteria bacterium]|nr:MAG: tRNA preQ1(34) S-adenosylmethionine ribosyltransferase-isomerase QueA [Pseudomonadota bacterium]
MTLPPVRLEDFDYPLPPEAIAQAPAPEREGARLLVLDRATGARSDSTIAALPRWLRAGDLVVVNATRVLPARLRGEKSSGGRAEALVLGPAGEPGHWRALLRCRGRQRVGLALRFGTGAHAFDAVVVALHGDGEVVLAVDPAVSPYCVGEAPLPPYIRRSAADPADAERYQTVFARAPGAVAAPTAGLHFGEKLLAALTAAEIERAEVVLHVGAGTFRPLGEVELAAGRLHAEAYELPEATARAVARTRARGGRVVAVGTTTTRVLEACATEDGQVRAGAGETDLFLRPGSRFAVVDALVTNFHLPRSSLLLLVAAFAGREAVLAAYADALRLGYRFYSYGDAMLIR